MPNTLTWPPRVAGRGDGHLSTRSSADLAAGGVPGFGIPGIRRAAVVASFPPRRCGIATFSADIVNAVVGADPQVEVSVAAIDDGAVVYDYPDRVRFRITEQALSSYGDAADAIADAGVEVVSLQHEFGLFGGPSGSHLLAFVRRLRVPLVTTFHSILREPNDDQRTVMEAVIDGSERIVVMTRRAVEFLTDIYGAPESRIDVIPHGIPDLPFGGTAADKRRFGLEERRVMLTFGLLGPGKGIEHAISAMPSIVARHPDVLYVILGATHPALQRDSGESYRESLERRARALGVANNVRFENRFVSSDELGHWLRAADIYVTPYPHVQQICSGTLAYAVGAGKAVISTPYWHAEELLADGRGVLVPIGDAEAIAHAAVTLLDDPEALHAVQQRAYEHGRLMTWSVTGRRYLNSFRRACAASPRPLLAAA